MYVLNRVLNRVLPIDITIILLIIQDNLYQHVHQPTCHLLCSLPLGSPSLVIVQLYSVDEVAGSKGFLNSTLKPLT